MMIRKTKMKDLVEIMVLFSQAQAYFKSHHIDQWQNGYPNEDIILQDIMHGSSYVLEENHQIIATMYLSFEEDPNYRRIDGKWLSNDRYGVIHRIVVKDDYKGKRIAEKLLDFSIQEAFNQSVKSIRVDTHEDNLSMQRFLKRNGFEKCGIVLIDKIEPRVAFEKFI